MIVDFDDDEYDKSKEVLKHRNRMRSTRGGYPVEGPNETGDFLAFTQTQLADKKLKSAFCKIWCPSILELSFVLRK